jgi:hypothetical protein
VASYWDGFEWQIHAYVIGGDGNLYDCFTNDGQNFNFDNHSNPGMALYIWGGGPGAAVGPSNTLHVPLYTNDGHLWDHEWDGGRWNWWDLGTGPPSFASPAAPPQGDAQGAGFMLASLATPTPAPQQGAGKSMDAMPARLAATTPQRQQALDGIFSSPLSPTGSSMSRRALAWQDLPAANPTGDPLALILPAI